MMGSFLAGWSFGRFMVLAVNGAVVSGSVIPVLRLCSMPRTGVMVRCSAAFLMTACSAIVVFGGCTVSTMSITFALGLYEIDSGNDQAYEYQYGP